MKDGTPRPLPLSPSLSPVDGGEGGRRPSSRRGEVGRAVSHPRPEGERAGRGEAFPGEPPRRRLPRPRPGRHRVPAGQLHRPPAARRRAVRRAPRRPEASAPSSPSSRPAPRWRCWSTSARISGASRAPCWRGSATRRPLGTADARLAWLIALGTVPGRARSASCSSATSRRSATASSPSRSSSGGWCSWPARSGFASHRRGMEDMTARSTRWRSAAGRRWRSCPGRRAPAATITTGMLLGFRREAAARFSFLLSVPIILGAGVYKLAKALPVLRDEPSWRTRDARRHGGVGRGRLPRHRLAAPLPAHPHHLPLRGLAARAWASLVAVLLWQGVLPGRRGAGPRPWTLAPSGSARRSPARTPRVLELSAPSRQATSLARGGLRPGRGARAASSSADGEPARAPHPPPRTTCATTPGRSPSRAAGSSRGDADSQAAALREARRGDRARPGPRRGAGKARRGPGAAPGVPLDALGGRRAISLPLRRATGRGGRARRGSPRRCWLAPGAHRIEDGGGVRQMHEVHTFDVPAPPSGAPPRGAGHPPRAPGDRLEKHAT